MKQRVVIAIALACNPKLLLADEPTTALDVTIQAQILGLMGKLSRDHGTAILLITHNMGVVAQLCDYVYVMYAGQIVEQAETFALFRAPQHPYTLGLLKAIPTLEGEEKRLYNIRGTVPDLRQIPPGCRFAQRCDKRKAGCQEACPPLTQRGEGHWARCVLEE
jgi:oligopeptide/dipeptide ABC transporter ATP-binding protein